MKNNKDKNNKNKNENENIWTADLLKEHLDALRESDQRALQIKEKADDKALDLARQIQTYKDEKANELREQINSERGEYLSRTEYSAQYQALTEKVDVNFKNINEFMSAQQGQSKGSENTRLSLYYIGILIIGAVGLISPHIH